MGSEHLARLRDPDWPELLATESGRFPQFLDAESAGDFDFAVAAESVASAWRGRLPILLRASGPVLSFPVHVARAILAIQDLLLHPVRYTRPLN